jgi:hypothetical protein
MLSKRHKVDSECRKFNESWLGNYFVKEHGNKVMCVICNDVIAVMKEYNIKRHYEKKHSAAFDKFSGLERVEKAKELCTKETEQQQIFLQGESLNQEMATRASYEVSKLIAEHGKAFAEGKFIKKCLTVVVEMMSPDKADFSTQYLCQETL